jgi:hypothetical protein
MNELWWQIPTTIATTVVTTILLRFVPWGTARLSSDTATIARDALTKAQWVFGQSQADGGRLGHPWKLASGEIHCHELESKLTDAHDRIKNEKFRKHVLAVLTEIHNVWAAEAKFFPVVWFEGKQQTPSEIEREKQATATAEIQLRHAQKGEIATKAALAKLGELAARA